MDHGYWHDRWDNQQIAFHEGKPNAFLVKYFATLGLHTGARVFVPLCGKTIDISWLLEQGYKVAGAELSETAISELFHDLGLTPKVTQIGDVKHFQHDGIDIFVGDIFDLSSDRLGAVGAVYDRAALVALPLSMRPKYASYVAEITQKAPQFLINFEYDQTVMDGPPFSISADEMDTLYRAAFDLTLIAEAEVAGGLKGRCPATEKAWKLT